MYDKCQDLQGDVIPRKLGFFTRKADDENPTLCCLMLSPDGEPEKPFGEMVDEGRESELEYMKNLVYRRVESESASASTVLLITSSTVRQDILNGLLKLHHAKVVFPRGLETCETLKTSETERYMIYDLADSEYHARCDPLEMVPETIAMFQQTPTNICSAFECSITDLGATIPRHIYHLRVPSKFLQTKRQIIDHYIPIELLLEPDNEEATKMIISFIKQKQDEVLDTADFRRYVQREAHGFRRSMQDWFYHREETAEEDETVAIPFTSLNRETLPKSWLQGVAKIGLEVVNADGTMLEVPEWEGEVDEDYSGKEDYSEEE
ncbi:uncharacterized protein BXZ73DRAFT_77156 [Epithele typhae]|uniref:uncharacterized protein n=1 Tax=Epithele typhae TaxID=378194 RepID=UPI0020073FAD|nr:uncharacterized protein BXZ73DRAFT_77156 [Epithele typhae]KAH9934066.1 hypothetical protein BXZ73DRAFT_77156 [Epithele typhae]